MHWIEESRKFSTFLVALKQSGDQKVKTVYLQRDLYPLKTLTYRLNSTAKMIRCFCQIHTHIYMYKFKIKTYKAYNFYWRLLIHLHYSNHWGKWIKMIAAGWTFLVRLDWKALEMKDQIKTMRWFYFTW